MTDYENDQKMEIEIRDNYTKLQNEKRAKSIYIIGDVHGCLNTLKALVNKLPKDAKIVFVGDLIDRGSNSAEVVKFIRDGNYNCVLGNHEYSMIENGELLLEEPNLIDSNIWTNKKYNIGGLDTLKSYKLLDDPIQTFKDDLEWMKSLPLYLEYPESKTKDNRTLVVSHSCVDDLWSLRDSDDKFDIEDFKTKVLYSRNKDPLDNKEIFNIFGHTPVKKPITESYYANIDTGAFYKEKFGVLTALEFPTMKIIQQKNLD